MPGKTVSVDDAIYALWLAGAETDPLDDVLVSMGYEDHSDAIIRRKGRELAGCEAKRPSRKGKG